MRSFLLICLALIACVAAKPTKTKQKESWKDILNSKVQLAELYARKSRNGKGSSHFGVVVTTWAGKRWLVHKGFMFGRSSSSVVTDARHMSKRWHRMFTRKVRNVTVGDYLKVAGKYFHPKHDNALHAAERMMKLGRSKENLKIGKGK